MIRFNDALARRRSAAARTAAVLAAVALSAWTPFASADPSVPWTPSTTGRHAIELLVDEAGLDLTMTHWPLPGAAVAKALDALPAELAPPLVAARDRVRDELRRQQSTLLTATLRGRADALTAFGDDATPGSSVELRSAQMQSPHLAMQIGARVDPAAVPAGSANRLRLDDSAVALEALGVQAQLWTHRSWWGPGWQNALALGNNAPALGGVGLQRASASTSESPWLSWMGPWNAEMFMGRSEGRTDPAYPFLIGTRLTLRPFSHLEIGLQRMAQWGGAGRNESVRSFVDMYFGLNTNPDTASGLLLDPANELAGYDLRLRCPDGWRCAAYGQGIGEDEAGHLPTKYLEMLGFEWWTAEGSDRFFIEGARTGCHDGWFGRIIKNCAYRNHAYPDGYTSGGRWLGDSAGPDSRLLTFGWLSADLDSSVRLAVGRIGSRMGAYSPTTDDPDHSGRLLGISARRSFPWGPTRWTPEFDWNRVSAVNGTRYDSRVGLEMSVDLDAMTRGVPSRLGEALSTSRSSLSTQALVGAALIGGAALLDHAGDQYATAHAHDTTSIAIRHVGDALPFVEFGVAGLAWLVERGEPAGDVAFASLEAGVTAVAAAEAIKQAVDRSRPRDGHGQGDFGRGKRSDSSFPSIHSVLAWSVLTPVAQRYDAPWLYGVAALTNAGRVMGRAHWVSDTVAGAVLGYTIGDFFANRGATTGALSQARVLIAPHALVVSLPLP